MDFIKNILMDKKYYESIDEVEQLLVDNDISESSVIQHLVFDKSIFPAEEDARLWAREHGFDFESVEEWLGDTWHITMLDPSEFVEDTFRTIDVVTGVQAVVGVLKQTAIAQSDSAAYLSLRNEESITLNDKLPHVIELAKVVSGVHVNYGKVELTKEHLESFVRNFNEGVVGVDLMIDYDHEQRGAAGWVKSVFTSIDGDVLFGEVKWTPKGAQCLSDREFRYFSPEFTLNYVHPHTGKAHGPTLLGGGLVNRPFLKMDAIVTFNNKKKASEVKMETIALTEHNAMKNDLEKQVSALQLSEEKAKNVINGLKDENTNLTNELNELKEEKAKAEKSAKHQKLFSENKINKAQLDALEAGKDMYEVLSMSASMNTAPAGTTGEGEPSVQLSEEDKAACKALGLDEKDYIKYNNLG